MDEHRATHDGLSRHIAAVATLLLLLGYLSIIIVGNGVAGGTSNQPVDELRPCGLTSSRVVEPRVVAAGETVTVSVRWGHDCRVEERRRADIMLLVEVSAALDDASRRLLPRVQGGLLRIANRLSVDDGSRGGLLAYDTRLRREQSLAGGAEGLQALRAAIAGLDNTGSGYVDPLGPLRHAESIFAAPSAGRQAIVMIDLGGSLPPDRTLMQIHDVCTSLQQANVHLAVLSLPGAHDRLGACATPGWHFPVPEPDGLSLPEMASRIATGIVGDPDLLLTELHEPLDVDAWTYVLGSGRPRDPDAIRGAERIWQDYVPAARAEYALDYRVRALSVERATLSSVTTVDGPFLALVDRAGDAEVVALPRIEVCVHPAGAAYECDDAVARWTATAVAGPSGTPPSGTDETPEPIPTTAVYTPTVPTPGNPTMTPSPSVTVAPSDFPPSVTPVDASATHTPERSQPTVTPVGWLCLPIAVR